MSSLAAASDTVVSDNSEEGRVKPAMACRTLPPSQPAPRAVLPGALPRGPQASRLAGKIDVRLSGDLRAAVSAAAKAKGLTDGAWLRNLVADAVGAEAASDRASGRRIPSELAERVAAAVREIGAAHTPLAAVRPDIVLVKQHLGAARAALMSVMKEESRS